MTERFPNRDLLAHRAAATPERTAMIDAATEESWSYRDLTDAVDDLAGRLVAAGIETGDRVGVLLPTRPAYARLVHALWRLGAVVVPLHARKPAAELADPLRRAGVETVIHGVETAETARALPDVEQRLSLDEAATGTSSEFTPEPWREDALAVVMFTSGTTGTAKGVRLTHGNLRASAEASAYRLGVDPGDRWLVCLPMYHMGGLAPVVRTALYGTTLVVQRSFDAETTAAVLADQSVTAVSLVPTMLSRLLDAEWTPSRHLETVLLGGAPASDDLIERCRDRGVPVYPTYGATETASQITTATPQQAFEHPGTVGQPLVNTTLRLLDDGDPVETGAVGEIVVTGPTVTPGYLDDDRTAAAVDDAGFHTGDLGYRDVEGRLWVVGRRDDMILTGGENVAPATVTEALESHPAVSEAAVVGLPDEEWGQRIAALVVGDISAADLDDHCRAVLADYECPKSYGFAEALPRTASGTVDRDAVSDHLRDNT